MRQPGLPKSLSHREKIRHIVRHLAGRHNEALGLTEMKLVARGPLAAGLLVPFQVLADVGDDSFQQIAYGGHRQADLQPPAAPSATPAKSSRQIRYRSAAFQNHE